MPRRKPLGARERTNNKLNPHMTSTPAVELRVTSLAASFPLGVGGECSLDVEFMDKILTFDYIFKFILGSEAWGNKAKEIHYCQGHPTRI